MVDLFQQITCGEYFFRPDIWCDISPEAQDLVRQMMTVCPHVNLAPPPHKSTYTVTCTGTQAHPPRPTKELPFSHECDSRLL